MAGFTKLFSSIVTSSIWSEDDKTRIMWVTMLATADADGHVDGAIPGMAAVARMTVEDAERAIAKLEAPDPYSRTADHEGRRIERAPGGWKILNYQQYRQRGQDKDGSRAKYMRNYRHRKELSCDVTDGNTLQSNVTCDTEAEADITPLPPLQGGSPAGGFQGRGRKRRPRSPDVQPGPCSYPGCKHPGVYRHQHEDDPPYTYCEEHEAISRRRQEEAGG
jgi:hypothetical protein